MPSPMPRSGGVLRHAAVAPAPTACRRTDRTATSTPSFETASVIVSTVAAAPSAGRTTTVIGRLYLRRELEVALIVRRHGHHRAGAVLAEHEVGDPDRHRLLVNGLITVRPVSKPSFSTSPVMRAVRSCARKRASASPNARCRARGSQLLDERMLGREQHERRAVDRVDARREDFDAVRGPSRLLERELARARLRIADPVALHRQHFLRPVVQRVERFEQLVGVLP